MKENHFPEIPEIVTVSSKGQIVIPKDIRGELNIKAGSSFAVASTSRDTVVLKKIKNPLSKEDLESLKGVEEAWKEIERGKYTSYENVDEFLEDMKKWKS